MLAIIFEQNTIIWITQIINKSLNNIYRFNS